MHRELIQTKWGPRYFWVNDAGQPVAIADIDPGFSSDSAYRDLMSRLPAGDLAGMVGPGVVKGGEQPLGLVRAALQTEKQEPVPTFRPLAGAQQNNRGGARVIDVDTITGTPLQEIPSIVETPRDAGQDAESITVSLGLIFVDQDIDITSAIDNTALSILARVQWGVGGASYSADIDWNQGTIFTLPASFVSVGARIAAIPIHALFPGLGRFTIAASLAYNYTGSSRVASPVRRTINLGTIAAGGGSTMQRVPRWANSCTVIDPGTNAPTLRIGFFDQAFGGVGSVIARYDIVSRQNLANQNECQFPIPDQARFFSVANTGLADMDNVRVVFNLAI